jgi:hypothetical protein
MSEDLDFVIPVPVEASRPQRSRRAADFRKTVAALLRTLREFHERAPLLGANNSRHYGGTLAYVSLLSGQQETIGIELSLREPLSRPAADGWAGTLLLDPVSRRPLVPPVLVRCLSLAEALAEKFRAALTRREVAIRDFYDIGHAVRRLGLRPQDTELAELVKQKLAVPGTGPVNVGADRLGQLRGQLSAQLKPVLRQRDLENFDLDHAFSIVREMARRLMNS